MGAAKLLVVDLAAVMSELDTVRASWIARRVKELRDSYDTRNLKYDLEAIADHAEDLWADAFPALELLRDESRAA